MEAPFDSDDRSVSSFGAGFCCSVRGAMLFLTLLKSSLLSEVSLLAVWLGSMMVDKAPMSLARKLCSFIAAPGSAVSSNNDFMVFASKFRGTFRREWRGVEVTGPDFDGVPHKFAIVVLFRLYEKKEGKVI